MEKVPQKDNAFAEYGTLCHEILEGWAKGDIRCAEMAGEYKERYSLGVTQPFPPFPKGMPQRYYDAGLRYFESFEGFGDNCEILSVEDKFMLQFGLQNFVGIADLILRDKGGGGITVIDHKSKSMTSMKKDLDTYRKQLYVYAAHVKEKYGEYPEMIRFNMFRDGVFIDESFSKEAFDDTMRWIEDTIDLILLEDEWKVSSSSYFCQYVCGVRNDCPIGEEIIFGKTRKTHQ